MCRDVEAICNEMRKLGVTSTAEFTLQRATSTGTGSRQPSITDRHKTTTTNDDPDVALNEVSLPPAQIGTLDVDIVLYNYNNKLLRL